MFLGEFVCKLSNTECFLGIKVPISQSRANNFDHSVHHFSNVMISTNTCFHELCTIKTCHFDSVLLTDLSLICQIAFITNHYNLRIIDTMFLHEFHPTARESNQAKRALKVTVEFSLSITQILISCFKAA